MISKLILHGKDIGKMMVNFACQLDFFPSSGTDMWVAVLADQRSKNVARFPSQKKMRGLPFSTQINPRVFCVFTPIYILKHTCYIYFFPDSFPFSMTELI